MEEEMTMKEFEHVIITTINATIQNQSDLILGQLNDFRTEVNQKFDAIDKKFDQIDQTLQLILKKLDK